jgi:hypothetical protein
LKPRGYAECVPNPCLERKARLVRLDHRFREEEDEQP